MNTKKSDVTSWIKEGRENLKRSPQNRKGGTRKTLHDRGVNAWNKFKK